MLNSKNEFGANNLAEIELRYGNKIGGAKRKRDEEAATPDEPEAATPDTPTPQTVSSQPTTGTPEPVQGQGTGSPRSSNQDSPPKLPTPPIPRYIPGEVLSVAWEANDSRQEFPQQLGQELPQKGNGNVDREAEEETITSQGGRDPQEGPEAKRRRTKIPTNLAVLKVADLRKLSASIHLPLKATDTKASIIVKIQKQESQKKRLSAFLGGTKIVPARGTNTPAGETTPHATAPETPGKRRREDEDRTEDPIATPSKRRAVEEEWPQTRSRKTKEIECRTAPETPEDTHEDEPAANRDPDSSPNQLRAQGRATEEARLPEGLIQFQPALSPTTAGATHTEGSHMPINKETTPLKKFESPGKGTAAPHPFKTPPTHQNPQVSSSMEGSTTEGNTSASNNPLMGVQRTTASFDN